MTLVHELDLNRWRLTRLAGELVRFRLGGNERVGRVIMDDAAQVSVRLWINAERKWDLTGPRSGARIPRGRLFPVAADDPRRKRIDIVDADWAERVAQLRQAFRRETDRAPSLQNIPALQNPTPESLAIRDAGRRITKRALADLGVDYGPTERRIMEYNAKDVALTWDIYGRKN